MKYLQCMCIRYILLIDSLGLVDRCGALHGKGTVSQIECVPLDVGRGLPARRPLALLNEAL